MTRDMILRAVWIVSRVAACACLTFLHCNNVARLREFVILTFHAHHPKQGNFKCLLLSKKQKGTPMLCTSWSTVPQCLEKIISPSSTTFDDIYENLTNFLLRHFKTIQWFEHNEGQNWEKKTSQFIVATLQKKAGNKKENLNKAY